MRAGAGVAILPEAAADDASGLIARVAIREPVLSRSIGILTRNGRSLSPAAQRLVEALRRTAEPRTLRRVPNRR